MDFRVREALEPLDTLATRSTPVQEMHLKRYGFSTQ